MNIIAFILMLIAAILFLFAPEASSRWGNRALGLFFLTVGLIVQFADHARSVTF